MNSTVTRVELLDNIERALIERHSFKWARKETEPTRLDTMFPTIQEHSQHWTLNQKQHMAFVLMAGAILHYLYSINCDFTEDRMSQNKEMMKRLKNILDQLNEILPDSKQLLMFLSGCGGSGKSRIIKAFLDFARRWNSSTTVVVTATSGIAAMLIGGCTLHSAIGFGQNTNPPNHLKH